MVYVTTRNLLYPFSFKPQTTHTHTQTILQYNNHPRHPTSAINSKKNMKIKSFFKCNRLDIYIVPTLGV